VISAFGPNARRYAVALGGLDAVLADPGHVGEAYVEAVRRHELGRPFYGMLLLEENRVRTLETIAPAVLGKWTGFDERRAALDTFGSGEAILNGRPAREAFAYLDPAFRLPAAEFCLLASALLVRSHAEYDRVNALCPYPRSFERVVAVPEIPVVARRLPTRPAIVVWAPDVPAERSALCAFALSEFHGDVTFVVGPGAFPAGLPGRFLRAGDPQIGVALTTATAVIVTDPADPGAAVAFAARGYGVAAPLSSGAHEYVRDIAAFDAGTPRTLQVAASIAIARPASMRELPAPPPAAPAPPTLPVAAQEAPLVSIIVPTFNRRDDIARCLEGLAAQTYPNVEAIVVNDAGQPVDDIVSRYPFARLIDLEENVGGMRACAAGMGVARGAFIGWLADDDWLYPDHIMRVATAMIRSGALMAHANGAIRHQQRHSDRSLTTVGFNAGVFIDTTTPTDALIATPIVLISALYRRELFDIVGPLIDHELADHEFQLRAAQAIVFAYVDQTTVEWRLRGESLYAGMDSPAGMRHIFEVLHPRPDRPLIERKRAEAIENVARRPAGSYMFPPTVIISTPDEREQDKPPANP
jgi:hypothetical protein